MENIEAILGDELGFKGSYLANKWVKRERPDGKFSVRSPANFNWRFEDVSFSLSDIDQAVQNACEAFPVWKNTSLEERINYLKRFAQELDRQKEYIAKIIAIETGKPIDEALGEAGLLSAKIDVTIEYGLKLIETQKLDLGAAGKGEIHYRPKGVFVVVGPFNFPVHLNHGHIVPALLTGNVCILKPSEKTPYSAQAYMDAAHAVGFPKGVLQMLQGDARVAQRLVHHSHTNGVLATCSYEVGSKIQESTGERPEKIIALEMGGKNAAIVWESNDLNKVASDLIRSSYLTTGQRCTALSRVYVKRALLGDLVNLFHQKAKDIIIDQPFATDPKPYMGPIISEAAMEKFLKYDGIAQKEGAETVMRPKALSGLVPRKGQNKLPEGYYVSPSVHVVSKWDIKSAYQNHEIFGPDLFFCPVDDLDDAINAVNSSQYGLSFLALLKMKKILIM